MIRCSALHVTIILFTASLMTGCTHPCGYVDIHAVATPTGDYRETSLETSEPQLHATQEISETNSIFAVRVEGREVTTGFLQQETYGRAVRVKYAWYAPVVKPIMAVTVFGPLFVAMHDPHAHGADNWTRGDYFRDVLAWYNFFSAVPNGPRRMDPDERLIRMDVVTGAVSEKAVGLAGETLIFELDGQECAKGISDAEGLVMFDILPHLQAEMAQSDHVLRALVKTEGEEVYLSRTIPAQVVQQLYLRAQDTEDVQAEESVAVPAQSDTEDGSDEAVQ